MNVDLEMLKILRGNSAEVLRPSHFSEEVSKEEMETAMRRLEKNRIKRFVGAINPLIFRQIGINLYLIFANMIGFVDSEEVLSSLVSKPDWRGRLNVFGLYGDKDFLMFFLGREDEKEILERYLRKELKASIGDLTVENIPIYMRLKYREPVSMKDLTDELAPRVVKDSREISAEERKKLLHSGVIHGFTILEKYEKGGPIKAFVCTSFRGSAIKKKQLVGYINRLARFDEMKDTLVSIYMGESTELDFNLVFEFNLDDFYELNEITNLFYGLSGVAPETKTYIASSCLAEEVLLCQDVGESGIHSLFKNLSPSMKKKYDILPPTRKARFLSTAQHIFSYELSHVAEERFLKSIDEIRHLVIKGLIGENAEAYKNCSASCGRLMEGVLQEAIRNRMLIFWPTETSRHEYRKLQELLQNELHLKQKINPTKASLGRLIPFIESWNKYKKDMPILLDENDKERLMEIRFIRNAIGAHWNVWPFDRIEQDVIRAIDCTLYVFERLYQSEYFPLSETSNWPFIAYRANNPIAKAVAERLARYFLVKGMNPWFFPWKVGWADSITDKERDGIDKAYAAIIVYTDDFLEGPTAIEEYRAFLAKRRDDPAFKVGLLLVDVEHSQVPSFMKDYLYVKISGLNDPTFLGKADIIHRGILGQPIENP